MIEIFDNCASKTFYIIRSIYTLDVIGIIRRSNESLIGLNKKNRVNGEMYKKLIADVRQQSQFNII